MAKERAFSLYDIEEILKDAGAERVNERAVVSFEQALEDTVKELLQGAQVCANYAGRSEKITDSDVELAGEISPQGRGAFILEKRRKSTKQRKESNPFRATVNVVDHL